MFWSTYGLRSWIPKRSVEITNIKLILFPVIWKIPVDENVDIFIGKRPLKTSAAN